MAEGQHQETQQAAEEQVFDGTNLAQELKIADWIPDALRPTWEMIDAFPLLGALVIIVVFYLAAVIFRSAIVANLQKLATRSASDFDDLVIAELRKPVFNTIFYVGLILAINAALLPFGTTVLVNLVASLIVVSWMLAALRLTTVILEALSRAKRFQIVQTRTVPLLDLSIRLLILLVASYVLLLIWGINPVGWLASAGIVGIAVGFAAKDTLANLFSGFFILADAPYKIGDYINLDTGERGKVVAIGMRSTRLQTRDDVEITVPNAVIAAAKITNESGGPAEKVRIRIPVGVAYGSDVAEVCEVLLGVADAHTEICPSPARRVRMRAFGPSSLDFELLVWINYPEDRGRITHELLMATYNALRTAGIEIPYTKTDVYIKEMPSG